MVGARGFGDGGLGLDDRLLFIFLFFCFCFFVSLFLFVLAFMFAFLLLPWKRTGVRHWIHLDWSPSSSSSSSSPPTIRHNTQRSRISLLWRSHISVLRVLWRLRGVGFEIYGVVGGRSGALGMG